MATMITVEQVREFLDYDPDTGGFSWRRARSNVKQGSVAGCTALHGYTVIRLLGKLHLAHRLAWLHHYGEEPPPLIDHINEDKSDNRIANLRKANKALNAQNKRSAQRNNKSSGLLGVAFLPHVSKFTAYINANGKRKYLGLFEEKEDAHAAYLKEKQTMHAGAIVETRDSDA